MKKTVNIVGLAVAFLTMCMLEVGFSQAPPPPPQPIPGEYIVLMKETAAPPIAKLRKQELNREQKFQMNEVARKNIQTKVRDLHVKRGIQEAAILHRFEDAVSGFAAKMSSAEAEAFRKDADVAGVYQNMTVSLGPVQPESNPPDLNAQAQTVSCAVQTAGGFVDGSAKAIWIWILDTGINLTHPDLNVMTSPTYAKSFIAGQTVEDGYGHGTHVAGIAAAKNNGSGVVGVSAGARVVPVKVLSNSGSGTLATLLAGVNHVATYDIPGDVVNMSLGAYPMANCVAAFPPLTTAILNLGTAGTSVVIASGNNGQCNGANSSSPGCINGNRVYTVGAINCNKTCAAFSNWGPNVVDWAAVGSNVYSTYKNGLYATLSGTSMATPVVAGIIHARSTAGAPQPPLSAGTVTCCGAAYKIAKR